MELLAYIATIVISVALMLAIAMGVITFISTIISFIGLAFDIISILCYGVYKWIEMMLQKRKKS